MSLALAKDQDFRIDLAPSSVEPSPSRGSKEKVKVGEKNKEIA